LSLLPFWHRRWSHRLPLILTLPQPQPLRPPCAPMERGATVKIAAAPARTTVGSTGGPATWDPQDQELTNDMNLTSFLFKAARLSASASAIASGKPKRIARRAKNVAVGRVLARAGIWRRLWK
jgi:hypothetical protein